MALYSFAPLPAIWATFPCIAKPVGWADHGLHPWEAQRRRSGTFDILVLFRAHRARAGNFSLFGQREVTKRKATPVLRFSSIHGRKIREDRPGLPPRRPWRGGKWAQSIAPTLRAFSSGPHRSTGPPKAPLR